MLSNFENVDEIDLNCDIEDDRKGDSSGALKASSHLCGRQLQQTLMVHMVHTHKCPHGPNTCYIILHYETDDQRIAIIKGKMMLSRDMPCVCATLCGPSRRMGYSSISTEKGC